MNPITREEIFLAKAIGETVPDLEPVIRKEMFLAKIAGMDITPPSPVTREEMYLNAIANGESIDLKPITRKEMFLAKAMGADIEVPNPITRAEFYLSQLTSGGGGSYEKYSWDGVFASIKKGTYATDYAIGDMIPLDLGSEGLINMQIVAFDADNLADGSGKAPITWISKEVLNANKRMNPSRVANDDGTYQEGTGGVGGWEKCEMRSYLKETIKPLIPEVVRNSIKEVTKTHVAANVQGSNFDQTSIDDVWLPDYNEMFSQSSPYKTIFSDSNSRIKPRYGSTEGEWWWLRTSFSSQRFYYVNDSGNAISKNSEITLSVVLCFCT